MIHSASSFPGSSRADALTGASTPAGSRPARLPADRLRIDQAATLRTGLRDLAEIRPEVVARARALAADPAYPSARIIRQVGAAIINAPDLSEEST